MWGSVGFLVLYLIAGLGGSCAMLVDMLGSGNLHGYGAGASGALWGILASMATWIFLNRSALPRSLISDWQRQLITVFILNVFITFAIPNISKGAHFGGGVVGLITAVPLDFLRFGRRGQRWLALAGLIAIPLLCVGWLVRSFESSSEKIKRAEKEQQEQVNEEQSDREIKEFNNRYLPKIREAEQAAQKTYQDQAEPLLNQNPKRRDGEKVRVVVEDLTRRKDDLNQVVGLLGQAGPFSDPLVEKARVTGKEYVEARARLIALTEQCLKQGENWGEKNQEALDSQTERMEEARQHWLELFRKPER
jgi:hypothetical protein